MSVILFAVGTMYVFILSSKFRIKQSIVLITYVIVLKALAF